jgi:cysteine-rich repeat protein
MNNDGCSSTCKLETCGDGIKQAGEECDDHNNVNGDGCSSTCKTECLPFCGDGQCNNGETCSTCSNDCGECHEEECHTCKDSKPLDQSGEDYYYYLQSLNKKTTIISEDTTPANINLTLDKKGKSLLENKFPLIALILIVGVLILLIFIIILRLVRRR